MDWNKFEMYGKWLEYFTEMHSFGIIGLHSKPEDAFNEINELSVVYGKVEQRFKTSVSSVPCFQILLH